VGGGVQLGPLGTAATNRPIMPVPSDYNDGEIGGMIGRGNRSTRRKPASMPICPPQTPHAARKRTRVAAVGNQRLTACATARPFHKSSSYVLQIHAGKAYVTERGDFLNIPAVTLPTPTLPTHT
jgi:hypothetical protein